MKALLRNAVSEERELLEINVRSQSNTYVPSEATECSLIRIIVCEHASVYSTSDILASVAVERIPTTK